MSPVPSRGDQLAQCPPEARVYGWVVVEGHSITDEGECVPVRAERTLPGHGEGKRVWFLKDSPKLAPITQYEADRHADQIVEKIEALEAAWHAVRLRNMAVSEVPANQ